jgi:hypothetical protein
MKRLKANRCEEDLSWKFADDFAMTGIKGAKFSFDNQKGLVVDFRFGVWGIPKKLIGFFNNNPYEELIGKMGDMSQEDHEAFYTLFTQLTNCSFKGNRHDDVLIDFDVEESDIDESDKDKWAKLTEQDIAKCINDIETEVTSIVRNLLTIQEEEYLEHLKYDQEEE